MKRGIKIVFAVVLIFILIFVGGMFYITRGLEAGKKLSVSKVDFSSISDGIYGGKYQGGRWSNELKLTIENHKLIHIEIIDDVLFKKTEVSNELFNQVFNKQSLEVDGVSGATVTCKAYLKSMENALNSQ